MKRMLFLFFIFMTINLNAQIKFWDDPVNDASMDAWAKFVNYDSGKVVFNNNTYYYIDSDSNIGIQIYLIDWLTNPGFKIDCKIENFSATIGFLSVPILPAYKEAYCNLDIKNNELGGVQINTDDFFVNIYFTIQQFDIFGFPISGTDQHLGPYTSHFIRDIVPPQLLVSYPNSGSWNNYAFITIDAIENGQFGLLAGAGVDMDSLYYQIDDLDYIKIETSQDDVVNSCDLRKTIEFNEDGIHTLRFKVSDKLGNASAIQEITVKIDNSGPESISAPSIVESDAVINILNKGIFLKPGAKITWNKPDDLPIDQSTGNYIGVGTSNYIVKVNNVTTGTSKQYSNIYDTGFTLPSDALDSSGQYIISVQGKDILGNLGQDGIPINFFVDVDPPLPTNTEDPYGLSINDPTAAKTVFGNTVTFYAKNKELILSHISASDGDYVYSSGIDYYQLENQNNGEIVHILGGAIALPELAKSENYFLFSAVDKIGNVSARVTIQIFLPDKLLPVTFQTPNCYSIENGIYYLNWFRPANAIPSDNVQYKVIIQNLNETAPVSPADFSAVDSIFQTKFSLENVRQNIDLSAYVFAYVDEDNWSISGKEFNLPLLDDSGCEAVSLSADTDWGPNDDIYLNQPIIVPVGLVLRIHDNTKVHIHGQGCVYIRVEGKLEIMGSAPDGVIINSDYTDATSMDWKGIIVVGNEKVDINYATIMNAERGLVVLPGCDVNVENSRFENCRIGIHTGGLLRIDHTQFNYCEWYAIKEDGIQNDLSRPIITGCHFKQNGYIYYHTMLRLLNIAELESLILNSDDTPRNADNQVEE